MEEEIEVPKYLWIESLRGEFANAIKLAEDIQQRLPKIYPSQDDDDALLEIKQVAELFSKLLAMPLDQLPRRIVREFSNETKEVLRDLTELKREARSRDVAPQSLANLLSSISSRLDNLLGHLQRWLPFLILKEMPNLDAAEFQRQLAALKNEQSANLQQFADSISDALDRANTAATNIEEKDKIAAAALGDIGVSQHADKFAEVQGEHRDAANLWFWGSVVLILLTAAVAILLYWTIDIENSWDSPANVHKVVFKLAVLTTLFYLISQSVKNYRINKHLEVVNRHRATALRTFRTFVENAGETDDVRHAVLIETTKTIFAPVSTGYVENEDDGPNSKIIELINLGRGK